MKTDNRKFFEFSLMSMVEYGYKLEMLSLNLYEDSIKDNIPTEYETRFVNLGMPIYKGIVKKMDQTLGRHKIRKELFYMKKI